MAKGTGKGWATGDCVRSRPMCHISDKDWNKIFYGGKTREQYLKDKMPKHNQPHLDLRKPN